MKNDGRQGCLFADDFKEDYQHRYPVVESKTSTE